MPFIPPSGMKSLTQVNRCFPLFILSDVSKSDVARIILYNYGFVAYDSF